MNESQIISQRESLVNDLTDVIERHRVNVGCGMVSTDIIGAIEWVKLEYYLSVKGDSLLDDTRCSQ